jgi:hypothetical protein
MRSLFGHLLPDDLLSRESKSSFDGVFFSAHSRAFARTWSGSGVPSDMVDADALRRIWRSPSPDARSFLLLQSLWLADDDSASSSAGERVPEQVGAGR